MKSFLASLILFALMLGAILWNTFYISRVSEDLYESLNALPAAADPDVLTKALELQSYWEKHAPTVGLSVSYTVTDRLSEQAATLVACASCGDTFGFQTAKALFWDAVGDMTRLEKISIENIL